MKRLPAMFEHFKDAPPTLVSAMLAILIALLRVIYDRKETSFVRMILESILCGALAVVAGSAVSALGLAQDWTVFIGGAIGFVGSQSIRSYADMFITKRFSGKD